MEIKKSLNSLELNLLGRLNKYNRLLIALVMCIYIISCVSYAEGNQISVYLNGKKIEFSQSLYIKNDRVMVPMRKIFEKLDATVVWDNDTQSITATKDGVNSILAIGMDMMYVGGMGVKLDSVPELVYSTTFVPLRAVSEMFGCEVSWNEAINRVDINLSNNHENTLYYDRFDSVPDFGAIIGVEPILIVGDNNFNYNISDIGNGADEIYKTFMENNGFTFVLGNGYAVYTKGNITVLAGYKADIFRVVIHKD